jgi:hypothetical protein
MTSPREHPEEGASLWREPAPSSPAAELAERALIGALMWDAGRLEDLSTGQDQQYWLTPQDFNRADLRAIYQTLIGLRRDGREVPLEELPAVLMSGQYHEWRAGQVTDSPFTGPKLYDLLSLTPARKNDPRLDGEVSAPSQHVRYADVVLEESIRRQIHQAGVRLEQTVDQGPGLREDLVEAMSPVLEQTLRRLTDLTQQLEASLGGDGAETQPSITAALSPTPIAGNGPTDQDVAGAVRARVELDGSRTLGRAQHRAEGDLLGAVLLDARRAQDALDRLRPADFENPAHAAIWESVSAMVERGEPVDFVLVSVELERRVPTSEAVSQPARAPAGAVGGAEPRRGTGAAAPNVADYVRTATRLAQRAQPALYGASLDQVAGAALVRAARAAQRELSAAGATRHLGGSDLLTAAAEALHTLEGTTQRLTGASASPRAVGASARIATALSPISPATPRADQRGTSRRR